MPPNNERGDCPQEENQFSRNTIGNANLRTELKFQILGELKAWDGLLGIWRYGEGGGYPGSADPHFSREPSLPAWLPLATPLIRNPQGHWLAFLLHWKADKRSSHKHDLCHPCDSLEKYGIVRISGFGTKKRRFNKAK